MQRLCSRGSPGSPARAAAPTEKWLKPKGSTSTGDHGKKGKSRGSSKVSAAADKDSTAQGRGPEGSSLPGRGASAQSLPSPRNPVARQPAASLAPDPDKHPRHLGGLSTGRRVRRGAPQALGTGLGTHVYTRTRSLLSGGARPHPEGLELPEGLSRAWL